MSISLPVSFVEKFPSLVKDAKGRMSFSKDYYSFSEEDIIALGADRVSAIKKAASKGMDAKVAGSGAIYKTFRLLEKKMVTISQIAASKEGNYDPKSVTIFDLKMLHDGLKDAISKTSKNRWIFMKIKDYLFTPVYVSNITYTPPSRMRSEEVELSLIAVAGKLRPRVCTDSISIYNTLFVENSIVFDDDDDDQDDEDSDLGARTVSRKRTRRGDGITIDKVLEKSGFFLSTPELVAAYEANYASYAPIADTCGRQFLPEDPSIEGIEVEDKSDDERSYRWWSKKDTVSLTVDGTPSKLILDDTEEESYDSQFKDATGFEVSKSGEVANSGQLWNIKHPVIPTMPVVRVFNLQSNSHVFVAANGIKEYAYDGTIWNKLVLPENDLDFIHMLLSSTSINISDIVHGKAKGIIVLCSGGPGLGKTLTAEASSEAFKKPFYSVQCSQLGIDPESLEKSLLKVLIRASRWEAILLLDEADVYVRRRSIDIQQNAIVGVFLRVLEYYRGVMFMTTNLGNDIDDAILSRATAHLQYELPELEALPKLWRVLADQMQVNISDSDIEQLIEKFGQLPGRSIRNLLKLSRYWVVSKKIKASAAVVIKVAQYLNVEHLTEKAVSKKLS